MFSNFVPSFHKCFHLKNCSQILKNVHVSIFVWEFQKMYASFKNCSCVQVLFGSFKKCSHFSKMFVYPKINLEFEKCSGFPKKSCFLFLGDIFFPVVQKLFAIFEIFKFFFQILFTIS